MIQPPLAISPFVDSGGLLTTTGQRYVSSVAQALNVPAKGTTANRPTTGVFVGTTYFDTTLGLPIWAKTVSPIAWVKADGTAA